jgi:hypothetical protein
MGADLAAMRRENFLIEEPKKEDYVVKDADSKMEAFGQWVRRDRLSRLAQPNNLTTCGIDSFWTHDPAAQLRDPLVDSAGASILFIFCTPGMARAANREIAIFPNERCVLDR